MIVECGNCETRFQLDESRIPLRGIRVRCSRCKEAFFLRHPDATEDEALHDAASSALGAADLPEPDEEDWEFNDDRPAHDPNEDSIPNFDAADIGGQADDDVSDRAEAGAELDRLDGFDADAESGLELEGDFREAGPRGQDDFAAAGDAIDLDDDPHAVGSSDDDFRDHRASDLTAPEREPADQAVGRSDHSDFGEVADFSALSDDAPAAGVPAPPRASAATAPQQQDVGDPEDWDFFNEETLERPYPLEGALSAAAAPLRAPAREAGDAVGPGIVKTRTSLERSRRSALQVTGSAIGWLLVVSLFCVGLGWGALQRPASVFRAPAVAPLGGFQAEGVRSYWLDTARAGTLYVVSGRLANPGARSASPAANVRVALVAASGGRLDAPPVPAGVPLAEGLLRELPPDQLAVLAANAAAKLAWTPIAPGAARDFQALFLELPPEAEGFVLELAPAVPSVPASDPEPVPGADPEIPDEPGVAATGVVPSRR